jgi:hypothetical protein
LITRNRGENLHKIIIKIGQNAGVNIKLDIVMHELGELDEKNLKTYYTLPFTPKKPDETKSRYDEMRFFILNFPFTNNLHKPRKLVLIG